MPIYPKEVVSFVRSSSSVDEAFMVIDSLLGSTNEKTIDLK